MILEIKVAPNLPSTEKSKGYLKTKNETIEGSVISHNINSGTIQIDFPNLKHEDLLDEDTHVFFGTVDYINPDPPKEETPLPIQTTFEPNKEKWEYYSTTETTTNLLKVANQLGQESWEMISCIVDVNGNYTAFFKRMLIKEYEEN